MKKLSLALILVLVPMQLAALSTQDLVSLVALPLAVAAVADVAGVPQDQLADLVATLNGANVPVTQEIQMIRYVPVALTVDNGAPFVDFVQTQVTQGVTGPALVPVVVERLQTFYPRTERIVITEQQPFTTFEPVIVQQPVVVQQQPIVTQPVIAQPVIVQKAHPAHPHGGPPGQLKKQLGLKTGAEVVHRDRVVVQQPMISSAPVPVVIDQRGEGNGRGKGHDKGNDKGNHGGQGKGHGKGH